MDKNKIIKSVAGGLRRMDTKPDYFLFCGEDEWCWDEEKILEIPVLHSYCVRNTMTDADVPFIPLWNVEKDHMMDRADFNRGYEENC
uniref:Uncharacterized protein n=2 Tax=viral metagenome TaxID=1070528 RepID=A0A6H1ZSG0_9ZZZZ